jgi:hypothetical protein
MKGFLRVAGLLTALALVSSSALALRQASPMELRAAFIFNFAKFTEWPIATIGDNDPISLCVVDDDEEASDMFRRVVKGRSVGTHGLAVRTRALDDNLSECQVVYAPDLDAKSATALLTQVADSPVLTISDYDQFARMGGVANFIVEDGMIRFAINVESTQRARLKVSSRLLTLAKVVRTADGRR